jgi:hypothetical protein
VTTEAIVAGITRFGERTAYGAAGFRCAECGEVAGVVRAARAYTPVDMGPPLGVETADRDGLVVGYFLGTAWLAAQPGALEALQALIDQGDTDPVALRRLERALAPFYCPDCQLNYCARDWATSVLFHEGFYDCTTGTCPRGHWHLVDCHMVDD